MSYVRGLVGGKGVRSKLPLGPDNPLMVKSLTSLASVYYAEGSYQKSKELNERATAIGFKEFAPKNICLPRLDLLATSQPAYQKAEPLYLRTLASVEAEWGPEHLNTAACLDILAGLYTSQGAYGRAGPLYERALAIQEKVHGLEHPETADSVYKLAELYFSQGAFGKAEQLYRRALSIDDIVYGPENIASARSLSRLGNIYHLQRAYDQAEPLYQRALAIHEKTVGAEASSTATVLSNLAVLYRDEGAYEKAEALFRRALTIREKVQGPEHPDTAAVLDSLAILYSMWEAYGKAEPLFKRAVAIREKILGPDHPDTAKSLNGLGALYFAQKLYDRAEPLYKRALSIYEKALGPEHPDTSLALNNLAVLYAEQGAYQKAEGLYQRALAVEEKARGTGYSLTRALRENLAVLSAQQENWAHALPEFRSLNDNTRTQQRLEFGRDSEKKQILGTRNAYLSYLRVPILLPEYRQAALPIFLQISVSSKARVNDELRASLGSLNKQAGVDERDLVEQLKSTWIQMSALISGGPGDVPVDVYRKTYEELRQREDDLIAKVSAKSEAFRVIIQEPTAADVAKQLHHAVLVDVVRIERWHPKTETNQVPAGLVYVATILFGDGHMDAVELGDAKPIDDLVASYRQAQEVTDNQVALKVLAERLGRKVLDPLIKLAGQHQDWYLSPDGPLRLIPFGALLLPDGKYAAERYRFWSLGSGRDLLAPATKLPAGSLDLVLANPDYGIAQDGGFAALPETEGEARAIRKAFPNARLLEAGKRSKQNLLALDRPPRILHLATHGYFQKEGVGDALLRAGIALDGANLGPDGLLTAKEAQNLRLNGTSLVVLSACDPGIGDVSFSEGLSGLQRSLALVGARTQLLTLWPVNSLRTKDFMEQFYARLGKGKTKGDAWIETQREMIRQGLPPHVWAPFVLYGDPGAL